MKILFTVLLSVFFTLSAHAVTWVPANGASCPTACSQKGYSPVISGVYKNGNAFSVCRSDTKDEGKRAGYNVGPSWNSACWVGWGGKETKSTPYDCLCN